MIKEYEVLYRTINSSGWEYIGKSTLIEAHKTMLLKAPECEVLAVSVAGFLSNEEKREIAARHGI